jgi:hypothetical protein
MANTIIRGAKVFNRGVGKYVDILLKDEIFQYLITITK